MAVERISLDRCRQFVGRGSDEELATVRDQLYAFADIAIGALCDLQASKRRTRSGTFDQALTWLAPEDVEDAEERAAIIQYEGGKPRSEAERRALDSVIGKHRRLPKAR